MQMKTAVGRRNLTSSRKVPFALVGEKQLGAQAKKRRGYEKRTILGMIAVYINC
jgi:hypothetical protein